MRWKWLCVFLTLAGIAGCSGSERPGLVKGTGTVTLDGKPVEGAAVGLEFTADAKSKYQRPSSAITDAQGKFTPYTYEKDDGLPVGKYKVTVFKREVVGQLPPNYSEENPLATPVTYKWVVPKIYSISETSGLTLEVTSSGFKPETLELKSSGQPEVETIGGRPQQRPNDP